MALLVSFQFAPFTGTLKKQKYTNSNPPIATKFQPRRADDLKIYTPLGYPTIIGIFLFSLSNIKTFESSYRLISCLYTFDLQDEKKTKKKKTMSLAYQTSGSSYISNAYLFFC